MTHNVARSTFQVIFAEPSRRRFGVSLGAAGAFYSVEPEETVVIHDELDLPFGAVHLLDGDTPDPEQECRRYASLLAGRTIDVACIGIGENGHLAFNDPPADFDTPNLVHVVTLDEACRRQQVGEGHFATIQDVPQQALSLSIPAILSARAISCVVPDQRKAQAVCCALEGPLSPDCPASALRLHQNCRLYLDFDSASALAPATTGLDS